MNQILPRYSYYIYIFLLIYLCTVRPVLGQTAIPLGPIGSWRTHFSYLNLSNVEIAGNKVFASSANGLFYYDKEEGKYTVLSKTDGLSETSITEIKYNPILDILFIGYTSGNIDLLKLSDRAFYNINAIKRANINGSRRINHASFYNDYAFLSCDFGIVKIDIKRKEVTEDYTNLVPNNQVVAVYSSAIRHDTLFVATNKGVKAGFLAQNTNLRDYNNWVPISYTGNCGLPSTNIEHIVTLGEQLLVGLEGQGIYQLNSNCWAKTLIATPALINTMNIAQGKLLICGTDAIITASNINTYTILNKDTLFRNPMEATLDAEGKMWVADAQSPMIPGNDFRPQGFGLQSNYHNDTIRHYKSYTPNGPFADNVYGLYAFENSIGVVTGGYNGAYQQNNRDLQYGYYIYDTKQEHWENYNNEIKQQMPTVENTVSMAFDPRTKDIYIGQYGFGMLVQKTDGTFKVIDYNKPTGTKLKTIIPGLPYCRIPGLAFDPSGHLWISNRVESGSEPSLHAFYPPDSAFKPYLLCNVPGSACVGQYPSAIFTMDIVIDDLDNKWVRMSPRVNADASIYVFDDKNNRAAMVKTTAGQGLLPSTNVNTMAKDRNGAMWIGTEQGVAVFYSPGAVFNTTFEATKPVYDQRELLRDEVVTSICVDAANRKWIGTQKSGIWLFDETGTEVINYFNVDNSPLISNNIIDVDISSPTGEVFIATDKGIISYRGTATQGLASDCYSIFPNPVKPGYEGQLTISGIPENAKVKITDVSGKLTYETTATGSSATWNLRDYNGNRPKGGVYIVFALTAAGESQVCKFAVID